ncbi:hypothetical protein CDD81_73 [Ophiocordyceps australis]|uniref:Uncharacterized protein n=1 Tax=Ophiocordyceps australis TaxID=1399860 RepID=A0A2C5XCM5_9HYPO|nr:hypothetical protein CDD81_73 [Ophiocordyceps australis]
MRPAVSSRKSGSRLLGCLLARRSAQPMVQDTLLAAPFSDNCTTSLDFPIPACGYERHGRRYHLHHVGEFWQSGRLCKARSADEGRVCATPASAGPRIFRDDSGGGGGSEQAQQGRVGGEWAPRHTGRKRTMETLRRAAIPVPAPG